MNANCLISNGQDIPANVDAVVQKAKKSLKNILDESGRILYSSCETLKPGKYYFLGFNPGEGEENTETIQESLDHLRLFKENAFCDEKKLGIADWSGAKRTFTPGQHPYQMAFKFLFNKLGVHDPRTICASNLIFKRSRDEKSAGYSDLVEVCWQVHKTILEIVQPEAIITFGKKPFEFVLQQCGGEPYQCPTPQEKFRNWQYSILADGKILIGLRHPCDRRGDWCKRYVPAIDEIRSRLLIEKDTDETIED
jgi:hypothetical protein